MIIIILHLKKFLHFVKGPDFPTGGIIYGEQGIRDACETGRGRIVVRAKTEIELTHSGTGMHYCE